MQTARAWISAVLVLGWCCVGSAQDAPAETPAAEAEAETEAETEAEAGTETPPVPAAPEPIKADEEVVTKAKQHFRQGIAFADAGNCGAAIVEFEAAFALIPRPNMLYNMAQCQERLFRYDLAIAAYERYLEEAPGDAPDRAAVNAALKTLGNLLGTLHIKSNVPAEVWIDNRLAGQAPGDVFVPAGGHSLELRARGFIPTRSEVRIVGHQEIDLEFELVKARTTVHVTETTGLDPTLFWIGTGATVVTASLGAFFALRVSSLHDDAISINEYHPDRVQAKKDVEDAELLADIFFGATALLAVGTTIVAFITDWEEDKKPAKSDDETAVRLLPSLAPGHAGLSLQGRL